MSSESSKYLQISLIDKITEPMTLQETKELEIDDIIYYLDEEKLKGMVNGRYIKVVEQNGTNLLCHSKDSQYRIDLTKHLQYLYRFSTCDRDKYIVRNDNELVKIMTDYTDNSVNMTVNRFVSVMDMYLRKHQQIKEIKQSNSIMKIETIQHLELTETFSILVILLCGYARQLERLWDTTNSFYCVPDCIIDLISLYYPITQTRFVIECSPAQHHNTKKYHIITATNVITIQDLINKVAKIYNTKYFYNKSVCLTSEDKFVENCYYYPCKLFSSSVLLHSNFNYDNMVKIQVETFRFLYLKMEVGNSINVNGYHAEIVHTYPNYSQVSVRYFDNENTNQKRINFLSICDLRMMKPLSKQQIKFRKLLCIAIGDIIHVNDAKEWYYGRIYKYQSVKPNVIRINFRECKNYFKLGWIDIDYNTCNILNGKIKMLNNIHQNHIFGPMFIDNINVRDMVEITEPGICSIGIVTQKRCFPKSVYVYFIKHEMFKHSDGWINVNKNNILKVYAQNGYLKQQSKYLKLKERKYVGLMENKIHLFNEQWEKNVFNLVYYDNIEILNCKENNKFKIYSSSNHKSYRPITFVADSNKEMNEWVKMIRRAQQF